MRERGRAGLVAAAVGVFLVLGPFPVTLAEADHAFCEPGSGAGQCQTARGVAVDYQTGQVYVADEGKDLIQVFDEDGGFEGTFGGSGVLSNPRAVAVDNDPTSPTQGQIAVIDETWRVLRFNPAGELRLGFGWGVRDGSAEAQTCGPDAAPASGSCLEGLRGKGECQLSDALVGSKVAIGPGGAVYVTDNAGTEAAGFTARVEVFAPDGSCADEHIVLEGENTRLNAIAVDSEAGAYVSLEAGVREIRKLDPAGEVTCTIDPGLPVSALAVDPASDRLYAVQLERNTYSTLTIFEPGCAGDTFEYVRRFGYTLIGGFVQGIGALPGVLDASRAGEAALGEAGGPVFHLDEPPPGPLIVPGSLVADPVSNTKATLGAEINPEGEAGQIEIEYVEKATCEADEAGGSECFDSALSSGSKPLGGDGFVLVGAEAQFGCPDPLSEAGHPGETAYEAGECLEPATAYRFRAAASNLDGAGNSPIDGGEFTTRPWLEFGSAWASSVGTGSARLSAEVNPLGVPVTAHIEVVDEPTCEADESGGGGCFDHAQSTPALDFGKGEGFTTRSVSLGSLDPGQTYLYRLVASNPLIEPVVDEVVRSFTTFEPPEIEPCPANAAFRTGAGALLPDCRGYEMVSPLDKDQADIIVLLTLLTNTPAALEQSSVSGSRLAYGALRAFADAPSAPLTSQYVAERRERGSPEEGWHSHAISSPIGRPVYKGAPEQLQSEVKALSPDLCVGWMRGIAEPPLTPDAQAGYPNLYRRTDDLCGGPAYEALTTAKWENLPEAAIPALGLELQGVSADGETAAFAAPDSLEGDAPDLGGDKLQLYVWERGSSPVFACILPNGTRLTKPCSAGRGPGSVDSTLVGLFASLQGALSASGQRLFWTEGEGDGKIYMREHPEQGWKKAAGECDAGQPCTIEVSKPGEVISGTEGSRFRAAAADGSAVIYTTGDDLYEAQIGEGADHPVVSLTKPIAGGVVGVMGASEDASHVYFASTEAIPDAGTDALGEEAKAGERNLYLYRGGGYAFIGALSEFDLNAPAVDRTAVAAAPVNNLARVTGDGEHAAFVSSAPLTGADNADVASAKLDTQVFLYDAGTDELFCASCNPSGARPAGRENGEGGDGLIMFRGPKWVAGWFEGHNTNLYTSRELSADGSRLFFNSTDALVARDTNGSSDVYQWEALLDSGSCTTGSPSYSTRNGGCLDLISSGQSGRDSRFLDASPSGEDVFFRTLSNLVPADYDLIDIYDARVGGGFPPPPPPAIECEGDACQNPPPAPPPPAPASAGYPRSDDVVPDRCAVLAKRGRRLQRTNPARARRLAKQAKRCRRTERGRAAR